MDWQYLVANGSRALYVCYLLMKNCDIANFAKKCTNITDAVLAATLKDLIEDGIIDRKFYAY